MFWLCRQIRSFLCPVKAGVADDALPDYNIPVHQEYRTLKEHTSVA
jgi:hypothetical protein